MSILVGMDAIDKQIDAAIKNSVREEYPPESMGLASGQFGLWGFIPRQTDFIPDWGTRNRDIKLREYFYNPHNSMIQGAITQMITRVVQTPWELVGSPSLVKRYQDKLQHAEFGEGWASLLTPMLTDFLTQDFGGFVEIIGGGSPDTAPNGEVDGLAYLDSLRMQPTGNFEFPYIYWSEITGGFHRMHHKRIARLVDMPAMPMYRTLAYKNGLSALSRMVAVSNAQILMSKYQNEKLSDLPPAGIMSLSGINETQWKDAVRMYKSSSQADGDNVWRNIMRLIGISPVNPVTVEFTPFAQVPDGFNYKDYMQMHVNLLALALGDDPQNIFPLSGSNLGTGTQSEILHKKGQAKMFGFILTQIERIMNIFVLPRALEFKFKYRDEDQDKEVADKAMVWATISASLAQSGDMSDTERRMLLSNQVEAYADVLLDESGQLRVNDNDPKDDVQLATEDITGQDAIQLDPTAQPAAPDATGGGDNLLQLAKGLHRLRGLRLDRNVALKTYDETYDAFVERLTAVIEAATGDEVTRRRFGTIMRDSLRIYGNKAYRDGLADGGVEDDLTADDRSEYSSILAEQSVYVTSFADSLFKGNTVIKDAEARAQIWANKSLGAFYNAGLMSADSDMMMTFEGDDGEESCPDCKRLKGQVHRLSEWEDKAFNPLGDSSALACGGYRCQHTLSRVKGRAKGSW